MKKNKDKIRNNRNRNQKKTLEKLQARADFFFETANNIDKTLARLKKKRRFK